MKRSTKPLVTPKPTATAKNPVEKRVSNVATYIRVGKESQR